MKSEKSKFIKGPFILRQAQDERIPAKLDSRPLSSRGQALRWNDRIELLFIGLCFLLFTFHFSLASPRAWAQEKATPSPAAIGAQQAIELIKQGALPINMSSTWECFDGQIPGSLCLPCGSFAGQASRFPKNTPLVFYTNTGEDNACPGEAVKLGYKNVYLLQGGLPAWRASGYETYSPGHILRAAMPSLKPENLARLLQDKKSLVIDIRPAQEFAKSHIEGAVSSPLDALERNYIELPRDRQIILVDGRGLSSLLAGSFLARKGFFEITRLEGGMEAWMRFKATGSSAQKRR